jgi:hypothetical protein
MGDPWKCDGLALFNSEDARLQAISQHGLLSGQIVSNSRPANRSATKFSMCAAATLAIAFSPDGERIAFFSSGTIKTTPVHRNLVHRPDA